MGKSTEFILSFRSLTEVQKRFSHHLNQFTIVQDLLDDIGIGLPVILEVRKTTLPTHLSTPWQATFSKPDCLPCPF